MSTAVEIIVIIIAGLYAVFLLAVFIGFGLRNRPAENDVTDLRIAVVVAARNEEKNIIRLLEALAVQSYTHPFDVIVVDDGSDDATFSLAESFRTNRFQLHAIRSNTTGKKAALTTGIEFSTAQIILVTDADCIPGVKWLESFARLFADEKTIFAAGMVKYEQGRLLRHVLQTEMIFLQVASAGLYEYGKASMCNGASMAFTRDFFMRNNGFTGTDHVSGDDVFLLGKAMKENKHGVKWNYSKDAIVQTAAALTVREAITQRHRWISKFSGYGPGLLLGGLFFLLVQLLFPAAIVASFSYGTPINPFVYGFAVKILVELLLLSLTAPYFGEQKIIPVFPLSAILYEIISLGAVVQAVRNEVEWKGRKWKQGKTK